MLPGYNPPLVVRKRALFVAAGLVAFLALLFLIDPYNGLWRHPGVGGPPVVAKPILGLGQPHSSSELEEKNIPVPPDQAWLAAHYPTLLHPGQLQSLYESFLNGYSIPQTGLFLSFPRTPDLRLVQQAATYDQGIAGILLIKLGDLKRAGKIVAFYERAWKDAASRSGPRKDVYGLANFYNGFYFVEGVEKIMHVGPNAWIGLLASRYARRTDDAKSLALALEIAHWIIEKVPHQHGAVAMGQIPWNSALWPKIFSTENNLSTLAFMKDLLKSNRLTAADRQLIQGERDGITHWLINEAYRPDTGTVLRGFHWHGLDTAGAIDSYTWFIASLRPSFIAQNHISPENLMDRAGKEFGVTVGGRRGIDCVDQAMADATYQDAVQEQYSDPDFLRPDNDQHRLIWFEGQSQYIVALQDMAAYAAHQAIRPDGTVVQPELLKKADGWLALAKLYTDEMDKASFTLPNGPAFPLATKGRFYLHGWPAPTPEKDHPADAVAPLIWRMFVGMGYEPLSDTQIAPRAHLRVKRQPPMLARDPGTSILYGASEEMSVYAWQLYEKHDTDGAYRQAKATISLWENDAKVLEQEKKKNVGTYYTFDGSVEGFQRIHNYWALNDVAACYFILARIADEQKNYPEAYNDLATILDNYSLAQMWDKRGWFWDPIDTIKTDYAEVDSAHYGGLLDKIPDIPAIPVDAIEKPAELEPYFSKKTNTQ